MMTIYKQTKERPQKEPNSADTWFWTSSLQNFEKINFCWLAHLVYVLCMAMSEETNASSSPVLQTEPSLLYKQARDSRPRAF